jgi:flagellar biosynthesis protein FliQ
MMRAVKPQTPPPVSAPQLTAHRIARFCKLAQMVLLRAAYWLASVACVWAPLERAIEDITRPFIAKMTRVVLTLILLKAWMQIRERAAFKRGPLKSGRPRRAQYASYRAIFGSRLRRLTRARDLRAKIVALLNLLNEIDVHAARLARRFASGLVRRIGVIKRETRGGARFVQSVFAPLALSDTS